MKGLLAAILALASCRQVFGLEPPSLAADAALPRVTGTYLLRYVHNNPAHQPIVDEVPISGSTATVRLDDGTAPPVGLNADGTFSFAVNTTGQRYRLEVTAPGTVPTVYDHDAQALAVYEMRQGRLDARVAPANTQLVYDLPDLTTGGMVHLFTTGAYMQTAMPSDTSLTIDWPTIYSSTGTPTLLDASAHDRAYLLYLTGTVGPQILDRYRIDDIDLIAGGPTAISGLTLAAPKDTCVSATALAGAEARRLAEAGFVSTMAPSAAWAAFVQPSLAIGPQYGAYSATLPISPATDTVVALTTGTPVPGAFLQYMTIGANVDIIWSGAPFHVANGVTYVAPITGTCSMGPITLGGTLGLPGSMTLDGATLDGATSSEIDRSHDLVLHWSSAVTGPIDRTVVALVEVGSSLVTKRRIVTTRDFVLVDPQWLEPGKTYVFYVSTQTGWSRARTGDFGRFDAPYAVSSRFSGSVTIAD